MKWLTVFVSLPLSLALVDPCGKGWGKQSDIPDVNPPAKQPPAAQNVVVRPRQSPCWGTVTDIGPESITIAFHEYKETMIRVGPDGRPVSSTERTIPATPPKEYKIAPSLAKGKPPGWFGDSYSYLINDVRVGDHVSIGYTDVTGVLYCEMICICRRPGGKIPPAPGERQDSDFRWHKVQQADVDREEKGLPPDDGRPQERPIAPAPREVVPRIPLAVP